MRILVVTSRFPYGPGEAFLAPELAAHLESGADVRVFPMLAKGGLIHVDAAAFAGRTDCGALSASLVAAGRGLVASPAAVGRGIGFAGRANSWAARRRNAAVVPRALALIDVLRRFRPDHVHAHWGGASSTIAMLAAETVGMPWSLTLHRWDIGANNLLERKLGSACFTRVISESGGAAVRQVVPHAQLEVIHMGVRLSALPDHDLARRPLRLVCVAGLVPVKDHLGLLAAFASVAADHDVSLDLIGGGPLEETIRAEIGRLDLRGQVRLLGSLSHAALLARLRTGEWGGVVLASRADGPEHEGIPVSLMEAMAAGIPVLGTDSGGTGELLGGGAGLLVPVNDFSALESALRGFVSDDSMRVRLAAHGYARIAESFDVVPLAARLRTRFAECGG